MALQIIDLDTIQPNGKPGDPARVAFGKVNSNFDYTEAQLAAEVTARQNADSALQQGLSTKADSSVVASQGTTISSHTTAIANLQQGLSTKADASTVSAQATAIAQRALSADLTAEITNRTNADAAILSSFSNSTSQAMGAKLVGYVPSYGGSGTTVGGYLDSLYTANGGSVVRYSRAGAGAQVRSISQKFQELPASPQDFGAVADGNSHPLSEKYSSLAAAQAVYPFATALTDELDWAATQAAVNASRRVYIPMGTYLLNREVSGLANYTCVFGEGQGSRFIITSATANGFRFGSANAEAIGVCFRNITIDASVNKTAGWAIHGQRWVRGRVENVLIGRPEDAVAPPRHFGGIFADTFDYITLYAGHVAAKDRAIALHTGAGFFIEGGTKITCANAAGSFGVTIGGGAGGIYVNSCDIIDCGTGLYMSQTYNATNNREVFVSALCSIDGSINSGVFVEPQSVVHLDLTGTWIATSGKGNGVGAAINIGGAQPAGMRLGVCGARLFNNGGGGIILNGGGGNITGCKIFGNGLGGGHGIHMVNPAVQGYVIGSNEIDNNGTSAKGYGLVVEAGINSYVITGNLIRANAQGQILDQGGANKVVANNLTT